MNQKLELSAFLIVRNEEKNIKRCLESISFAEEIVVVDTGSTDKTIKIAKQYTDKVYSHKWEGFGKSKNRALSYTTKKWVLSIDADELVTKELMIEIKVAIKSTIYDGYKIFRLPFFLGKTIKHSGWYPASVLRLFNRNKGQFSKDWIHERVILHGKIGSLKSDLLHFTYETVEDYLVRLNKYTTLSAKQLLHNKRNARITDIVVRPPVLFLKMFVWKLGFLDGLNGFILAVFSSFYPLLKYSKAYLLQKQKAFRSKVLNKRLLVIKNRGMGDCILMLPFLENLAKYYKDAQIDILVPEHSAPLFKDIIFINKIISSQNGKPFSLKILRFIRKQKYDMIINLHSSTQTEWLVRLSKAKKKIVHQHGGLKRGDLDIPRGEERIAANERDLLVLEAMHIPFETYPPKYPTINHLKKTVKEYMQKNNVPENAVWIAPFASCLSKTWAIENFIAVAERLRKKKINTVFLLNSKEFQASIPLKYSTIIAPQVCLLPTGLLKTAVCYLGNDAGPSHLVASIGIPTVIIFGPTSVKEWHPYKPPRHIALSIDIPCRGEGCGLKNCKNPICLEQITVDMVYSALFRICVNTNN